MGVAYVGPTGRMTRWASLFSIHETNFPVSSLTPQVVVTGHAFSRVQFWQDSTSLPLFALIAVQFQRYDSNLLLFYTSTIRGVLYSDCQTIFPYHDFYPFMGEEYTWYSKWVLRKLPPAALGPLNLAADASIAVAQGLPQSLMREPKSYLPISCLFPIK